MIKKIEKHIYSAVCNNCRDEDVLEFGSYNIDDKHIKKIFEIRGWLIPEEIKDLTFCCDSCYRKHVVRSVFATGNCKPLEDDPSI